MLRKCGLVQDQVVRVELEMVAGRGRFCEGLGGEFNIIDGRWERLEFFDGEKRVREFLIADF